MRVLHDAMNATGRVQTLQTRPVLQTGKHCKHPVQTCKPISHFSPAQDFNSNSRNTHALYTQPCRPTRKSSTSRPMSHFF